MKKIFLCLLAATFFTVQANGKSVVDEPLKLTGFYRYECLLNNSPNLDIPYYFFHQASHIPQAVDQNDSDRFRCHKKTPYGERDSVLYPRVNHTFQGLVWDPQDKMFHDENNNGRIDLDEAVEKYLLNQYGEFRFVQLFDQMKLPSGPKRHARPLGMILRPFINPISAISFCPTLDSYLGHDRLMNVLEKVLAINTEPIYALKREPIVLSNGFSAPDDFLFLQKNVISSNWFYLKNGVPKVPTGNDHHSKQMYVFWPLNKNQPYKKSKKQYRYKVVQAQDVTIGKMPNSMIRPSDKSLGCVPLRK